MKAMILAAGLGTRFKPWTDHHPKALALINGKSLLERNLNYLQSFGIKDVLINIHHFPDQIRHAIIVNDGWGSNISISDESDEVLETGGGLKRAADYFDQGSFVLMKQPDRLRLRITDTIATHESRLITSATAPK